MDDRENWLRAVEFRYPEWIPCRVDISPRNWKQYRADAERIVLDHPRLFEPFEAGSRDYDDMPPGCDVPWANLLEKRLRTRPARTRACVCVGVDMES